MKFNTVIPVKLATLAFLLCAITACDDDLAVVPIPVTKAPLVNVSPGDFTLDLTSENNVCSKTVTLDYNLVEYCTRVTELEVTIDAPGLISQTPVSSSGDISFDVEFCILDSNVPIILTVEDECNRVTTHVIIVEVLGRNCIDFQCQKFVFGLNDDGTKTIPTSEFKELTQLTNLCDHIDIDISYSLSNINDTLITYTCQSIIENGQNPNINQTLYYSANGEFIDSCRIVVFFSNDFNGDGDASDGWQEICDF